MLHISATFLRSVGFHQLSSLGMATMPPQAKRIKLEHSYAFLSEGSQFEPVMIKEEDPLKICNDGDVVETIKIEIADDNIVKSEPVEEVVSERCNFEYLNIPSENEHISPDQYTIDSSTNLQCVGSERNSLASLDNPIEDPLQLVNVEYVVSDVQNSFEVCNINNGLFQCVNLIEIFLEKENKKEQCE